MISRTSSHPEEKGNRISKNPLWSLVILEHSVELLGTQNSSFKESHYTDIDRIQESLKMKLNRQTCQRIHENTTQFCSTHKYGFTRTIQNLRQTQNMLKKSVEESQRINGNKNPELDSLQCQSQPEELRKNHGVESLRISGECEEDPMKWSVVHFIKRRVSLKWNSSGRSNKLSNKIQKRAI